MDLILYYFKSFWSLVDLLGKDKIKDVKFSKLTSNAVNLGKLCFLIIIVVIAAAGVFVLRKKET